MAVFLMLAWFGAAWLRRRLQTRPRPIPLRLQALAALAELERRPALHRRDAAFRLNEILRAALAPSRPVGRGWPYEDVPGIVDDPEAWRCFWHELECRYRPVGGSDDALDEPLRQRWIATARNWLMRLPLEDERGRPWMG